MSTTTSPGSVFGRWIDDAAVFPPGSWPVPDALAEHRRLRSGGYADLLGPLLLGASAAGQLVDAAAPDDVPDGSGTGPVEVCVVARAGTSVEDVLTAVERLRSSPALEVVGVEVTHDTGGTWGRALELGARVAVEVPREGTALVRALDDLADAGQPVLAKLRTQATADTPAPSPRQLAEFLAATGDRELAFKLTGGLHRAVAHGGGSTDLEEPHGGLNVLVATHHRLDGASLVDLAAVLEDRDGPALASLVRGWTPDQAVRARSRFVAFGCCGVLDPITDLTDLGLLPRG